MGPGRDENFVAGDEGRDWYFPRDLRPNIALRFLKSDAGSLLDVTLFRGDKTGALDDPAMGGV